MNKSDQFKHVKNVADAIASNDLELIAACSLEKPKTFSTSGKDLESVSFDLFQYFSESNIRSLMLPYTQIDVRKGVTSFKLDGWIAESWLRETIVPTNKKTVERRIKLYLVLPSTCLMNNEELQSYICKCNQLVAHVNQVNHTLDQIQFAQEDIKDF